MAVGKRIYLKRHMPDKEVMMQFKNIPASNTCDVMGRNAAMNPRIRLVSQPKEQMAVGPALTVKARGGDNLALHAALNIAQEGDFLVVSNEEDDTRSLMREIMMAYHRYDRKVAGIVIAGKIPADNEKTMTDFFDNRSVTLMRSASGIFRYTAQAQRRAVRTKRDRARLTYR